MTTQTPSVSNQASASSTTPPPVSFTSLPYELRQSIVLLACTPSRPWHVSIDVDLALNLMLAHSATYGPTAPLLYRNVRITKASQLVEFARALVAKPSLGAMVRGLHLGPDCLLPGDYWPLTNEKTIKSSLRGAESVPRWWQQWVALSPTYTSMRLDQVGDAMFPCAKAVWQAMEEAQVALGIDLQRPRLAPDGQTVAPTRGFMGVLEVQAALDLYLIELRRLEDQREASAARNGYGNSHVIGPPLAIKLGAPTEAVDPAPQGIFTLHHLALIEHLARRGAAMDHFEHPYRLLKSGLEVVRLDDDGIGRPSNSFIERLKGLNSDAAIEDFAQQHMLGPSPTALHSTLPASSTTGGILELARQVLAQAPQIEHLSLGSYFQLLLWRDGVGLPASLRSLCLGPLSEFHDMSLCPSLQLQGDPFTGLEKLHISGHVGWERKVVLIANLPRLKEAVWDIKLANFDLPYDEGARAHSLATAASQQRASRRVDVWTHPSHSQHLLNQFGPPRERDAGVKYFILPCKPHCFYVLIRRVHSAAWAGAIEKVDVVYDAKREWWEECVTGTPEGPSRMLQAAEREEVADQNGEEDVMETRRFKVMIKW